MRTVSQCRPNVLAASRTLIPSAITARRTRRYTSTLYIRRTTHKPDLKPMNGGGRSNLQSPFVRDYPPARDNLPPPLTALPGQSSWRSTTRHLPEQKLRSLRPQTCTVRPQVQQATVSLIIVTLRNATPRLLEKLLLRHGAGGLGGFVDGSFFRGPLTNKGLRILAMMRAELVGAGVGKAVIVPALAGQLPVCRVSGVTRWLKLTFDPAYVGPCPVAQRELRAIALVLDLVLRPVMLQCPGSPSTGSRSTSRPWSLMVLISTSAT